MTKQSYILEGIDRLGKSTLINNLMNAFGFFNYMHYEKPKALDVMIKMNSTIYRHDAEYAHKLALREYQMQSFVSGFKLLLSSERFIFDRFHLGEAVYAHRYRDYSGEYIFGIEKEAIVKWERTGPQDVGLPFPAKMILLTTSDFSFIQDDGLSFDFSKKEEEQADFIKAFTKSRLPKVMIDVSNGQGGFKDPKQILEEAING